MTGVVRGSGSHAQVLAAGAPSVAGPDWASADTCDRSDPLPAYPAVMEPMCDPFGAMQPACRTSIRVVW
jgi:hypothetical protein